MKFKVTNDFLNITSTLFEILHLADLPPGWSLDYKHRLNEELDEFARAETDVDRLLELPDLFFFGYRSHQMLLVWDDQTRLIASLLLGKYYIRDSFTRQLGIIRTGYRNPEKEAWGKRYNREREREMALHELNSMKPTLNNFDPRAWVKERIICQQQE